MFKYVIAIVLFSFTLSPSIAAEDEKATKETNLTNDKGEKATVRTDGRGSESEIDGGSRKSTSGDRHDEYVKELEDLGFRVDK